MMLEEKTIQQFLDELSSASPTPGGGSASAVMGAMGAALVSMVCHLTLGKKNYASVHEEIKKTLAESEALRGRLMTLMHEDVEVFDRVIAAYQIPKESATRSTAIEEALKAATDIPLACAEVCATVLRLSRIAAEKGNQNIVSDAGVAVAASYAALRSAVLNVRVNTSAIKDEGFVASRLEQLECSLQGIEEEYRDIYHSVFTKCKGK